MVKPAPNLTDALSAARSLLGYKLIHKTAEGITSGIIVETEAYTSEDKASHSYNGRTTRNEVMFGPAGRAYVYFTYGMHYCFNIVTGPEGSGQAVLIRALEPIDGLEIMMTRRGRDNNLTNGPAKLVQAMGITKNDNGKSLLDGGNLRLEQCILPTEIVKTTRIGIKKDIHRLWRFYIKDSPNISHI